MCGIAGFVGLGDEAVLKRMTDAIQHRGPDAEGFWHDAAAAIFLGHRRLSIVDLDGGAQPMWIDCGEIGIVFNGEIYNHEELRRELKECGRQFHTDHSDTEVLLHGYAEWGDAFVERLNGMWAFVIYDRKKRRLFGSRDRFGKKPLYYFKEGETFAFASELSALIRHPSAPRTVSILSVQKYFAYCYIPAPRSIYERIWKLPGGHSFSVDLQSSELRVWRYWQYVIEPEDAWRLDPRKDGRALDALCEELRDTLENAVRRRLMSDVPLGVFLSGGIDSSGIAAMAAKHVGEGALNTFAIGFSDPSFDESKFAALVASKIGSQHSEQTLDLEAAIDVIREIVPRLDEPLGDSSLLPTYLLSRFTRQKVTVALGGDGGDELFAGYDPFRALSAASSYSRWVPQKAHDAVRMLAGMLPVSHRNISFDFKVKRTLAGLSYPPPLWNAVWMGALEPAEFPLAFPGRSKTEEIFSEAIEAWDRCAQPNLVDRSLQFWTDLYLQDGILAKVDRASMLCSLEARSPFLDIEVANLARRIPWQLKLHGAETKWILKRALTPLLPKEIVERPKKGFGMPVGRWMRSGRFAFDTDAAPPGMNAKFSADKLNRHLRGSVDERLFLWCEWLLMGWLDQ